MTTEAQRDVNAIDSLLKGDIEREPVAPAKRHGKGAKPVPVAVDDDDDNESAVNDDEELPPLPVTAAVRPTIAVPGLPDIGSHPAVVAAQVNVNRVVDQKKATAGEIAQLEATLGLKPGASARDLDNLAARILAAGGTDGTADQFAKLESLRTHAKRLGMALEIATGELHAAREKAVRDLSAQAWEVEFKPAARASALALLALIAAKAKESDARTRLRVGGFGAPNGTFGTELLNPHFNSIVLSLVRDQLLTREEVRAVCPHMNGI